MVSAFSGTSPEQGSGFASFWFMPREQICICIKMGGGEPRSKFFGTLEWPFWKNTNISIPHTPHLKSLQITLAKVDILSPGGTSLCQAGRQLCILHSWFHLSHFAGGNQAGLKPQNVLTRRTECTYFRNTICSYYEMCMCFETQHATSRKSLTTVGLLKGLTLCLKMKAWAQLRLSLVSAFFPISFSKTNSNP